MKRFKNNVQYIKFLVNSEITRRFREDRLSTSYECIDDIQNTIIPGPDPITRCCIYKERYIIGQRVRFAMKQYMDDEIIHIIPTACDECPVDRFKVTELCRGCLAHKCIENCPRNAIEIVHGKAFIDQKLCIECGKCKGACDYQAITDLQRPCVRACEVGAIYIDEERKTHIDKTKCISCGHCVQGCPFGAMVDKSFVLHTIREIKKSQEYGYGVHAVVAPSICTQFPDKDLSQVFQAIKEIGFADVWEAALGADMVAYYESQEFLEDVTEKGFKTTSCCPAFVEYVRKHSPGLLDHVSTTISPMVAVARYIKTLHPGDKVVFIGPCIAKKKESMESDDVDHVITFQELYAIIKGCDISIKNCQPFVGNNASFYGRGFAKSGGVSKAVMNVFIDNKVDFEIKPINCNGIAEVKKTLKLAELGRLEANFIEGMACVNGCIGGAAVLGGSTQSASFVENHGKTSTSPQVRGKELSEKINMLRR